MKVVLAGAYGNLGADIFRELNNNGYEVVALDMAQRDIGVTSNYEFKKIDVTDPKTLEGGKRQTIRLTLIAFLEDTRKTNKTS